MLFDKPVKEATFTLSFPDMKSITAEFAAVSTVGGDGSRLPDPLIPIPASKPINLPLSRDGAVGATRPAVLVELHTGDTKPGTYTGRLQVTTAQGQTTCDVVLTVWNFELPDQLTFLPELNCYDLPANEREYYRLAHRHRTVLNRVPYYQRGTVAEGCAPQWDGKRFDWSAWDQRFGAYFDGSAFADLPRAGVPLELFYLPLHENWPTPMEGNYNGSYWAESAFPASYREAFVEASRQYAEHLGDRRSGCWMSPRTGRTTRPWPFLARRSKRGCSRRTRMWRCCIGVISHGRSGSGTRSISCSTTTSSRGSHFSSTTGSCSNERGRSDRW